MRLNKNVNEWKAKRYFVPPYFTFLYNCVTSVYNTKMCFLVSDNVCLQIFYNCLSVDEIFSLHNSVLNLSQNVQQNI